MQRGSGNYSVEIVAILMELKKTDFSAACLVTSKNSLGERDFLRSTHFPNALFCFVITTVQNIWKIRCSGAESSAPLLSSKEGL